MAEVIRKTPIAFEDHTRPHDLPPQPPQLIARWKLTWHNPHAKVPHEEPHVVRETHPMSYRGVRKYARNRTRYYEDVKLVGPVEIIDIPEIE